jgi:hypothetical protein
VSLPSLPNFEDRSVFSDDFPLYCLVSLTKRVVEDGADGVSEVYVALKFLDFLPGLEFCLGEEVSDEGVTIFA